MRPITIYNPQLTMYKPLRGCVRRKDLIITEGGEHRNPGVIIIKDKNLEVRGIHACIQYLDEKYPCPPFFPQEPEKRAIVRMAIDDIIRNFNNIAVYEDLIPDEGFFAGPTPTVLDIIVYELAPDTECWAKFKDDFERAR